MHNLNDKICPLINTPCLIKGCTFFNEMLDGCEISIMNYNLYQLKEHIKAQLNKNNGVPESRPVSDNKPPTGSRFPRPVR
jgi:hypothetical protein